MNAVTLEKKPFALRMSADSIAPARTGHIAVIMDLPPADSIKTGDMLVLELFRDGGLRQGYVELDLAALAARVRSAFILLSCWGLGCTAPGVSLRADGSPGPQACSQKALEAMKILRLRPGDSSASIVIDANQSSQSPVSLTDGPVESYLLEELGYLSPLTRLYGQIWTGGPNVIIRYYEARPPDGEPIPICAVARLGRGGLRKKPESPPGVALIDDSRAAVFIVDGFR